MGKTRAFAVGSARIELVEGNIVQQQVDVVVNAANRALAGGGGVDGAIHQAAGWERLQAACRMIGQCPTGSAVMTPGFDLPASWIIHAVGPIWSGGFRGEPELLAAAYRSSLDLAAGEKLGSIAFPSLSTGVYGYPMRDAAEIALATAREHLATDTSLHTVRFVLFGEEAFGIFEEVAEKVLGGAA